MNVVITIIKILIFSVSIILLISSYIRLYRWRKSAFNSTIAYLRNLRHIPPGEKVCIQAPDEPGLQYVRSDKSPKAMVYWEYCYTVEGFQYCKSYFYEEDETKLPAKIRVYYNRKHPKIMYREGAVRDGVIISLASIILSTILLFAVVAPYIW